MSKISYIDDFETWKDEFRFSIDIPIRFSETDMFGHVNNVSPFIYFEQARIEFLTEVGVFDNLREQNHVAIVSDLQCDYLEQMFFRDTLKLFVKANSIGNSSIDIHYLGMNQHDKVCLTGRGRLVNIDMKTGKPVPFSDEQKEKVLNYGN